MELIIGVLRKWGLYKSRRKKICRERRGGGSEVYSLKDNFLSRGLDKKLNDCCDHLWFHSTNKIVLVLKMHCSGIASRVYWFPAYKHPIKPTSRDPAYFECHPVNSVKWTQGQGHDSSRKERISKWKGFQNTSSSLTSRVCDWNILFQWNPIPVMTILLALMW